jgi:hypothetical protein
MDLYVFDIPRRKVLVLTNYFATACLLQLQCDSKLTDGLLKNSNWISRPSTKR